MVDCAAPTKYLENFVGGTARSVLLIILCCLKR